jgi:hypothetical protein
MTNPPYYRSIFAQDAPTEESIHPWKLWEGIDSSLHEQTDLLLNVVERPYASRHLGSCFEMSRNYSVAMTKVDHRSLLSSHRARRSNFLLSMLLQLDGHVLFSENGSLTLLLTIDFTRHRVLVKDVMAQSW